MLFPVSPISRIIYMYMLFQWSAGNVAAPHKPSDFQDAVLAIWGFTKKTEPPVGAQPRRAVLLVIFLKTPS
jgi:hypothetical protein